MGRTMDYIGQKRLNKLTQSKVLIKREIDFQYERLKLFFINLQVGSQLSCNEMTTVRGAFKNKDGSINVKSVHSNI